MERKAKIKTLRFRSEPRVLGSVKTDGFINHGNIVAAELYISSRVVTQKQDRGQSLGIESGALGPRRHLELAAFEDVGDNILVDKASDVGRDAAAQAGHRYRPDHVAAAAVGRGHGWVRAHHILLAAGRQWPYHIGGAWRRRSSAQRSQKQEREQ